ncbi:bag family molecular chaperone regulator 2 [Holotrichia oblita]|uniref:Bag family molecular chaperone regulator 2 n=1 Tax=Holotrichia oblita TaxID=644536 RepID=A0ACB9TQS4_HOLOL|nr:bag family molecular chaperone regulator 2 [Holotrichia oblita]
MSLSSNLTAILPKIDEDNIMDPQTAKQKMTEILDMLEGRVEKLRKEAATLEEDKDHILASLDSIRTADWILEMAHFEQEETHRYLDRIIERCLTVDIKIHTQRDQPQEEALHQVNHLIDALVMTLKTDPDGAKEKCISYMNACSSQHVHGIMDKKFENALLGCTLDDQKRVKKRLQGLLSYLDRLDVTCEVTILPNESNNEIPHQVSRKRHLDDPEQDMLGPKRRTLFIEETQESGGTGFTYKGNNTNEIFVDHLLSDMNKLSPEKQTQFKSDVLVNLHEKLDNNPNTET